MKYVRVIVDLGAKSESTELQSDNEHLFANFRANFATFIKFSTNIFIKY